MDPIFIVGQVLAISDGEPLRGRLVGLRSLHSASARDPDWHPVGRERVGYTGPMSVCDITGRRGEFLLAVGVDFNTDWVGGYYGINVFANREGTGRYRSFQGNLRSYADIAGILRAVGIIDSTAISSVTTSAHRMNEYLSMGNRFGVPEAIRTGRGSTSGARPPGRGVTRSPRGGGRGVMMTTMMCTVGGGLIVYC